MLIIANINVNNLDLDSVIQCLYLINNLQESLINLYGGQPKMYWWLCCTGVKKSHKIAHICCQTQGQHIQWKNYIPPMTVHRFGVDPQWNYDVTWNPRTYKANVLKIFNVSQREIENFCHSLEGNLEEQYVRFWKDQIQQQENQGNLRTFKKFKTNLNFEEYLNEISNIKHRQAVTKLRISSHRLPVGMAAIVIFLFMKQLVNFAT